MVGHEKAFERFELSMENGGAFLVAGKETPNIMTIGWATTGYVWKKPVIMVMVRPSRYTYSLMDEGVFTVCLPKEGEMKQELGFCGSKSGRDFDKAKELGLTFKPSNKVEVPNIEQCGWVYECKTLYTQDMKEDLCPEVAQHYPNGNLHTLYFAEILDCYENQ